MLHRNPVSAIWLILVLSACGEGPTSSNVPSAIIPVLEVTDPQRWQGRVRDGHVSVISEFALSLETNEVLEIETSNISPGGDPVMHLLDRQTGEQLASSSPGTDGTTLLSYSGPATSAVLVIRSRVPGAAGTVNLWRNGLPWQLNVEFGGWHLAYSTLPHNERLQLVHLPNGATGALTIYVLASNNEDIEFRLRGGRVGGAPDFEIPSDLGRRVVLVGVRNANSTGRARIIRNDVGIAGSDPDADGLGTELEEVLGTCESLTGSATGADGAEFDCSLAADPKDTDGDGLRDGWEVLGLERVYLRSENTRVHENLLLPAWGANPRHKDLFIEVDFMERELLENPQKLSASIARQFTAYYQDQIDDPSALIDAFRAAVLRNPDQKRGINVHLDTGRAPQTSADAVIYGDWGGYTSVPPVPDGEGGVTGADFKTAWKDYMSPARRGIFRYILAYSSGGGQAPINSFAISGPMDSAWVLAHEFGHGMGLAHSGPAGATGVVDPNCKPNYQSLLNYAFQSSPVGFSDGLGAPALNNTALREWTAVSPNNTIYIDVLETVFNYWVDREHGHVDWNRDGEIAPEGATVRAYANFKPGGGGCEFTRYNSSAIPNSASVLAPAMARLGNRVYTFFSVLGSLRYTFSTDAGGCPVPDVTPCANWASTKIADLDAHQGVDIIRIGTGDDARLMVVTIDQQGKLWQNQLSLDPAGNEEWGQTTQIPSSNPAAGQPSLADLGHCKVFLAYRGADNLVRFNRLSCSDDFQDWRGEENALDENGFEIEMADFASPGIGRAYLDEPGVAHLYGAFADASGRLDLYQFDEQADIWRKTALLERRAGPIEGRPALAWTSERSALDNRGRFYLMFVDHDTTGSFRQQRRTLRMMTSYVKVDVDPAGGLTRNLRVGLYAPFDNVWAYGFGIDLLFEPGFDTNLQSIHSVAINKPEVWATLQYRPKADAINDFLMTDYNDWEVMRRTLCNNLVNPGGLLPEPAVQCPTD